MKSILLAALMVLSAGAWQPAAKPETVMVTYHAKPGAENELARVLARHWATARDLKLVRDAPRLNVRGVEEGGKTFYVEIFTWRDAAIPDHAPAAIQSIWAEMGKLVEARSGRPGIEIVEVSVVGGKPASMSGALPEQRWPRERLPTERERSPLPPSRQGLSAS